MRVQAGSYGGEGWSPHQYDLMVQSILSSAHHAVPVSDAIASIGKPALEALAQANLISYRPLSCEGSAFCSFDIFTQLPMNFAKHLVQQLCTALQPVDFVSDTVIVLIVATLCTGNGANPTSLSLIVSLCVCRLGP